MGCGANEENALRHHGCVYNSAARSYRTIQSLLV